MAGGDVGASQGQLEQPPHMVSQQQVMMFNLIIQRLI